MGTLLLYGSTVPIFFLLFLFVYILSFSLVFRNWGDKQRKDASSSFMSLAHGTPAIIMAIQALLQTQSSTPLASPNSASHNRVLEFSMAYFLMDLLHYLIFVPNDFLYILHHLATLYVLVTCRYTVYYGAYGILVVLVLAEITSACQNVWSISGYRKAEVPAAAKLHQFLTPPFLTFYSVVRGVLGPLFALRMGVFFASGGGKGVVPGWAWVSWMVVIVTGILVSILWVSSHWRNWCKTSHQLQKKQR